LLPFNSPYGIIYWENFSSHAEMKRRKNLKAIYGIKLSERILMAFYSKKKIRGNKNNFFLSSNYGAIKDF
jgi:hypothetical protein